MWRNVGQRLGLVLFGIFAACALTEVAGRLLWQDPVVPGHLPPPPPGVRVLKTKVDVSSPNVEGFFKGVIHKTNRHGFRGPDYSDTPADGVFRIVLIGDSIAMGQSVEYPNTYASLLETMLNEQSKDVRYEVLNLGVSGMNIKRVIDRLASLGMKLQPHLVVYGCTINDIEGLNYRRSFTKWAIFSQAHRLERYSDSPSYLVRLAWPRLQSLADLLRPPKGSHLYEVLDNYFHNPLAWEMFEYSLYRLAEVSTPEVPVVLFQHTSLYYLNLFHPFKRVYEKIQQYSEGAGIPVIQSFPVLRGHDARTMWVAHMDPHPNERAHRLFAEALYAGLVDGGFLTAAQSR